jgi:transcriptional regulator with GAF, ATPase, and Fis domain
MVVFGSSAGAVERIDRDALTIGRHTGTNPARLMLEDARMSRQHIRIEHGALGWQLVDLGSRNGGFVNGEPFASESTVALGDDAIIRVGDTLFAFRTGEPTNTHDLEREVFPGASPLASEVRRRLALLAAGHGHVLVLGETGTGKERVARRIGRSPSPFVPQNCAEVSRDLARTELFGHVRGAFTGATNAREGLVELAGEGVLFLDEVGELPYDVQGDLLRFLEDGSYRPIGASELRTSSARVVAATNVDLDAAVRVGGFRRDLLARLRASNAPLVLPPLRDRREDILGWARRFLAEAYPGELPAQVWTAGAAECVLLYPWPENLRELRGAMRALVETPPLWPIASKLLPEALQAHRRRLRERAEPDEDSATTATITPTREEIERALTETEGRMRTASALLGLDRRKLYRLCEKLGINIGNYRSGGS